MLIPRTLKRDELHLAQSLIYDVYITEQCWTPPENNPTNYRIDTTDGNRLIDDLDETAVWMGVFDKGQLVAVVRATSRPMEWQLYVSDEISDAEKSFEVNRLVVRRSHRKTFAYLLIQVQVARHALKTKSKFVCTTATYPFPGELHESVGFQPTGIWIEYPESTNKAQLLSNPVSLKNAMVVMFKAIKRSVSGRKKGLRMSRSKADA